MRTDKLYCFYKKYRNFILYALIGIFSTGVEFAVYFLLCRLMPYLWANVIGFQCGILCSYFLNRSINFKVFDRILHRFLLFFLVQTFCLLISETLLYVLVDMAGIEKLLAKGLTFIPLAVLPYILNKNISFRKHK